MTPAALAGPPRPATAEQVKELITAAGEAEDFDGADFVYVLDEADVFVRKSGLATTEGCQVIKILTDAGVKSQSVLRFEFDPDTTRTTIKSVTVHRKDGEIEEVPLSAVVTQPATQHWIYWGGMQHLLSLPRVEVGESIEVRTSKTGFNIAYLSDSQGAAGEGETETLIPPMPGHWYEVTLFQGRHPIVRKRYSVHMPKDMPVQYEVYNGELKSSMWFDGDRHVYTWSAENIPPVKKEPHMVELDDCVPKLVMATLEDWEAKSRWFYEVNEPQFEADAAIRAKVAELTAGLKSDEEKVSALTHWVADNIRYYGTKQGGSCEGYTLHKSINTFRDRGGVCKDKAGMLVTMLRVGGYEAFPALTMAGSRVEYIPADQFNHTVTVMRDGAGGFQILDPTWVPLFRDVWSSFEAEQGLVYGVPEGQDLTLSPYYEPEYNMRHVRADSIVDESGRLSTNVTINAQGAAGNRLRRAIDGIPEAQRRGRFEDALAIAANARLGALDYTDPYDYSRNAQVKAQVTADGFASMGAGVHMLRMPLMSHPLNVFFRPGFMEPGKSEARKYGMRFWATRLIRYEESIKLPGGWKVAHVPEAKSLDSGSASVTFNASADNDGLTYRFEFVLKKGVVPAEDYDGYSKAVEAMNELGRQWIVCTAGDEKSEKGRVAEKADAGAAGTTR